MLANRATYFEEKQSRREEREAKVVKWSREATEVVVIGIRCYSGPKGERDRESVGRRKGKGTEAGG